jgi:hypothetical protein
MDMPSGQRDAGSAFVHRGGIHLERIQKVALQNPLPPVTGDDLQESAEDHIPSIGVRVQGARGC